MANRLQSRGRFIDLFVQFRDSAGNLANTDRIPSVEISDANAVVRQILTNQGVTLACDPGLYQFSFEIPLTGPDGYWTDRWVGKIGDESVEASFEFLVLESGSIAEAIEPDPQPGSAFEQTFTKAEVEGIDQLLRILKKRVKNDGTRKVSDGAGGFIDEFCAIFSNDELICFLINSLSEFNQIPHFSDFQFSDEQIRNTFSAIIIQGAVLLALAAQTLIEKGREFSITDNGVTYQPPMVSEILNTQFTTQLADYKEKLKFIKANLKPSPKGLGTFRVTAVSPNFLRLRHLRERQIV